MRGGRQTSQSVHEISPRNYKNPEMCVTAFYINDNPSDGGYKFIILFNRDEFFNRATKAAHFWTDHPDVVGGVDMTPGKEGGTWLGLSKKGRVAIILNIFNPDGIRDDAKGRGALVSDFLTGEQTTAEYLKKIAENGEDYNGFNLFTIDISNGDAAYYSNTTTKPPQKLQSGIYGVSNSTLDKPWPKANHLKTSLEDIIQSSNGQPSEDLQEKLHSVLERTSLLNGEQFSFQPGMTIEGMKEVLPQMVHVKSPVYGTRSSTVITVDTAGEVIYSEKSLEEPIDHANLRWTTKEHKFHLTCAP